MAGPISTIININCPTHSGSGDLCQLTLLPPNGQYFEKDKAYYAVVAAGQYWNGFSVIYYTDDKAGILNLPEKTEFKPGVFKRLDKKDANVEYIDKISESYAVLNEPLGTRIPNYQSIKKINVYTNSDKETKQTIYVHNSEMYLDNPPIYYEVDNEMTLNLYTKGDRLKVLNASNLFSDFQSLISLDLSAFDTSESENFRCMFSNCFNLQGLDLGTLNTSRATDLAFMFQDCRSLKKLDLSHFDTNNVKTMQGMFFHCINLEKIDICGFQSTHLQNITHMFYCCFRLTGVDMGAFDLSNNIISHSACQCVSKYSKICAIRCSPNTQDILKTQCELDLYNCLDNIEFIDLDTPLPDYHKREDPNLYYSKDFRKDKSVKLLHKAKIGNGVNVVFMGDAYSDRMIDNGKYDADIQMVMNAIFNVEPFKSFKDMFNIYQVYAVSENESGKESTVFEIFHDPDQNLMVNHIDNNMVKEYITSIPNIGSENNVPAVIVVNGEGRSMAGHEYTYMEYPDYCDVFYQYDYCCVYTEYGYPMQYVAPHEFGHCFGCLGDEYEEPYPLEDWERQNMVTEHKMNMNMNLDTTNDPSKVIWKNFLDDSRYSNDGIGIFLGGNRCNTPDIWRPSENSIMRDGMDRYNAPSREAIYRRIHSLAYGSDWRYDYEDFVRWDMKNIQSSTDRAVVSPYIYARTINARPIHKESTSNDGRKTVSIIMN